MPEFDCYALSAKGADADLNEDSVLLEPDLAAFAVADGLGGRPAGALASRLAVSAFAEHLRSSSPKDRDARQAVRSAFEAANRAIRAAGEADPAVKGLGTTLSALLISDCTAHLVHAGDSRIYASTERGFVQLTRDHTLVAELVERQHLQPRQVHAYPFRNVLTRSLGAQETVEPDTMDLEISGSERFILVTDGITKALTDQDLGSLVETAAGLDAKTLATRVMSSAQAAGLEDNATVVIVGFVSSSEVRMAVDVLRKEGRWDAEWE